MPDERSSAGDPATTLRLLWRDADGSAAAPRRGPRRTLTTGAVVDAATALADRHGLAALTMRTLAEHLGVAPMTLYTYVPGRAELVDLMLDAAYARMPRTPTTGRPWRERLRAVADDNRALYRAHPWAAGISTVRPPLGPGQMAKYEHELSALDGLGLSDVQMDDALTHLLALVRANAGDAEAAGAASSGAVGDDRAWWEVAGPLLSRVLDPATYPLAVRVGTAAGAAHGSAHDPDHAYRFGVARVLDGLAPLIDAAAPGPS